MGDIRNVLIMVLAFLPISFGRERYMDREEMNWFLKNFYSHYVPSLNRDQRDIKVIPPGSSLLQEPSSRDLDVGIAIGVKDDNSDLLNLSTGNNYSPPHPYLSDGDYGSLDQSKEVNIGVYVDPRNGVAYYLPQSLQLQHTYNNPQRLTLLQPNEPRPAMFLNSAQPTNLPAAASWLPELPVDYTTQRRLSFLQDRLTGRYKDEVIVPLPYSIQGQTPYAPPIFSNQRLGDVQGLRSSEQASGARILHKFFGMEENVPYYRKNQLVGLTRDGMSLTPKREPAQIIIDPQQEVPIMTAEPYGERQVGAFRLRNDHGYQVTMNVPRIPEKSPSDGVLVMEMKATLYRPVA